MPQSLPEPVREMRETADIAKSWFEEGRSAVDSMGIQAIEAVSMPTEDPLAPGATGSGEEPTPPAVDSFGSVTPAVAGSPAPEVADPELPGGEERDAAEKGPEEQQ